MQQLQKKNLLQDFPIKVTSGFVVLDGQHRVEAAKRLGIPVIYEFVSNTTIDDVAGINSFQDKWKGKDFIHFWCQKGIKEFQQIRHLMDTYNVGTDILVKLCHFHSRDIRTGRINCPNKVFNATEEILKRLQIFKDKFTGWSHRHFAQAFAKVCELKEYDHTRMIEKLKYLSGRLHTKSNVAEYILMLEEIYNYKSSIKIPFSLLLKYDEKNKSNE